MFYAYANLPFYRRYNTWPEFGIFVKYAAKTTVQNSVWVIRSNLVRGNGQELDRQRSQWR